MPRMTIWYSCDTCEQECAQVQRHRNMTGHDAYTVARWDPPHSYRSAHYLVRVVRGHPTTHRCTCGEPATGWALNSDVHKFGKLEWSPNPDDYTALCEMCHKHQDWPADEWRAAAIKARSAAGARGGNALRERRREDPELDAKILKAIGDNGKRLTAAPEHVAKMQAGIQRKRETDPEFNERYIESKRRAGRISAERRRAKESQ